MFSIQLLLFTIFTTVSLSHACTRTTPGPTTTTVAPTTTTTVPTTTTTVPTTTPLPACVRGCPLSPEITVATTDLDGGLNLQTVGTVIPCDAADAASFAAQGQEAEISCVVQNDGNEDDLRYRISSTGILINTIINGGAVGPGEDNTPLPITCGAIGWLVNGVTLVDGFGCD